MDETREWPCECLRYLIPAYEAAKGSLLGPLSTDHQQEDREGILRAVAAGVYRVRSAEDISVEHADDATATRKDDDDDDDDDEERKKDYCCPNTNPERAPKTKGFPKKFYDAKACLLGE
jgi:hypothetical protein